jgi:nitroreductase
VNLTAFEEIVNNRRSNRKFAADITVPDEVIKKALELAILAPNSSNLLFKRNFMLFV